MATKKRRARGEGSIFENKVNGGFVAKLGDKRRYAKTRREAVDKLNDLKAEAKANTDKNKNYTISQIADAFLSMKAASLKPTSYDRLESTFNCQIKKRIGDMKASAVTDAVFRDKVIDAMYSEGLSYYSIKKAWDAFNACMRYGKKKKLASENPLDGCDAPTKKAYQSMADNPANEGAAFAFSDQQRTAFAHAAYSQYATGRYRFPNRAAYILCMKTGLRMGELLALRWVNVDLDNSTMRICEGLTFSIDRDPNSKHYMQKRLKIVPYTKTGQPRTIRLAPSACDAIKELEKIAKEKNSPYVVSNKNGGLVKPRAFQDAFSSMCDLAGITLPRGSNVHVLRHTFASALFAKGVPVKTVSSLLGHSSTQITQDTYIHLIQNQEAMAIDLIDIEL